ncbi:MAG TPA: hypothetical protein VFQ60_05425, partial [Patescibacteria group bacterium]|nr:hypothetical protein [Patescibacteria group bacterium]
NTIWLWRADQSTLVLPGMFLRATADPLHQKLAVIESTSTGPLLAYWSPSSGLVGASPIPNSSSNQFRIDWQSEGNALLINELNPAGKIWWSKLDAGQPFVDVLPQASYYWSENILRGSDSSFLYQIDPATRKFLQTQKSLGIVDATKNLTLQTTSTGILLKERSLSTRLFALPSGQWNFGDLEQFYILLHDHDHWLAMDTASPPYAEQLTGDHPRWLMGSEPLSALFVNDGEVWMWQMGKTPALLWRQSEPIQEVDWHRSGTSVFIADQHHLFALELDDRNGRQITQLADFDQIRDFGLIGKSLFIAGTKNGISGLWKIEIE